MCGLFLLKGYAASMMNKFIAIGNMGGDPDSITLSDGTVKASFRLATEIYSKNGDGTFWISCVAFGKQAEIIRDFGRKGRLVYVEGPLSTREWTDKSGQLVKTTECKLSGSKFLDKRDSVAVSSVPGPDDF